MTAKSWLVAHARTKVSIGICSMRPSTAVVEVNNAVFGIDHRSPPRRGQTAGCTVGFPDGWPPDHLGVDADDHGVPAAQILLEAAMPVATRWPWRGPRR